MKTLVFVYGTLRKGGKNAQKMNGARFVSKAHVQGSLYRIDWYPGLVLKGENLVLGEIYEVTATQLEVLDVYEGGEYARRNVQASTANGTITAQAWIYKEAINPDKLIESGDWLEELSEM